MKGRINRIYRLNGLIVWMRKEWRILRDKYADQVSGLNIRAVKPQSTLGKVRLGIS